MEESQGETATAHFPEQMWEYHPSYGKDKSLYARMAELLWNSGHEEQHRKHERIPSVSFSRSETSILSISAFMMVASSSLMP